MKIDTIDLMVYPVRRDVVSFDRGTISNVTVTDQGYLRCEARITKVGVFSYPNAEAGLRRQLRLPEEVFAAESVNTFDLVPLTDDHPGNAYDSIDRRMLTAENTNDYQVGIVCSPKQNGNHLAATVQITDAAVIAAAKGGKRELSCGYHSNLDIVPGITCGIPGIPDGLQYDAIQRNIRGNHVALVDTGRAGPDACLCLDSVEVEADVILDRDPSTVQTLIFDPKRFSESQAKTWAKEHGFKMLKAPDVGEQSIRIRQRQPEEFQEGSFRTIELRPGVKAVIGRPEKPKAYTAKKKGKKTMDCMIDGISFDVEPQVAQAVHKLQGQLDELKKKISAETVRADAAEGRADAAEESLKVEKQARLDAEDPARLRERIEARLALERQARQILGENTNLDAMTDIDIQKAVITATARDPGATKARLDGASESYVIAQYEHVVDNYDTSQPNEGLRQVLKTGIPADAVVDADDARKRMIGELAELGRRKFN